MKKNGFAPIIILILLVLIVGGAYYFGTLKNKNTSTSVPSVQPSTSPVVKPTANPTVNWKTYTNTEGAISFKYPSTVSITSTAQGGGLIIKIVGLDKEISLVGEPTTQHNFYAGKKVSKTFVYNGIDWNYLTGDAQFCDGGECSRISDVLQTTNQGKRWTIVLGSLAYPDVTLDQILSTFKFTN